MSVLFFSVAGFGVKARLSRRNSGTTVPRCKRQLSPPQRHVHHMERGRCWRCSDLAPASLLAFLVPVAQPTGALHGNALGIRIPHRCGVFDVDWSRCRWNMVAYAARSCAEPEDTRLGASVFQMGHAHILASWNTHPHRPKRRLPCETGTRAVRASISSLCQACYQLHL